MRALSRGTRTRRLLGKPNLRLNLPDPHQDLAAQLRRHRVTAAMPGDQPLDRLLKAELPQARTALVQVLADALAVGLGHLPVQVPVHPVKYLAARHFVRLPAAHDLPSPASAASARALAACARTRPRSAA